MRHRGDVDDGAFLGADVGDLDVGDVEAARGHAPRGARGRLVGLDGRTVRQVGVEEDLQVGPQRGQFGPQRRDLVGGLGPQLGGQFAAQLALDGQLVLPARRDLAVQLQVVDELQVACLGLVEVALAAIDDGDEGRHDSSPQRQDDGEFQQLHAIGEHQR